MKLFHQLILSTTVLIALGTVSSHAQSRLHASHLEAGALQSSPWLAEGSPLRAPQHTELATERIFGTYITDDIANQGQGLPTHPGTLKVATFLPMELVRKFHGCDITTIRFGLPVAITVNNVFILAVNSDGSVGEALVTAPMTSQAYRGWNLVPVTSSFTIDAQKANLGGYLLGYEYEQVDYKSGASYTQECYPLSFVKSGKAYHTYVEADGQWSDIDATALGNLSVQCVVNNAAGFPQKDIIISPITIDSPLKQGGDNLDYSFSIENFGSDDIANYAVSISLDNDPLATLNGSLATLTSEDVSRQLSLPASMSSGSHKLTVAVRLIDGTAPTTHTQDDVATKAFAVYSADDLRQRQQYLVENFTSTAEPYTTYADAILQSMMKKHADVTVVNIHGNVDPSQPDPLHAPVCDDVQRLLDQRLWPTAAFNRVFLGNQSAQGNYGLTADLAYETRYANQMANEFFQKMEGSTPSLASLTAEAIAVDDQLTVTVSGEGNRDILSPIASLTVYLVEDGVVSAQQTINGRVDNYTHDHVLRSALSMFYGDALTWTDAQHFTNTFTMTLPSEWNAEKMSAVAFVHLNADPLSDDYRSMGISNAVEQRLTVTSAISAATHFDATVLQIVSSDGRVLNAPTRGLNILRMSDGTTRKVINN